MKPSLYNATFRDWVPTMDLGPEALAGKLVGQNRPDLHRAVRWSKLSHQTPLDALPFVVGPAKAGYVEGAVAGKSSHGMNSVLGMLANLAVTGAAALAGAKIGSVLKDETPVKRWAGIFAPAAAVVAAQGLAGLTAGKMPLSKFREYDKQVRLRALIPFYHKHQVNKTLNWLQSKGYGVG